tara:strand:+ start:118 stop:354 length:237 start_codon:yes stop_codon:yes gene_type:complete
MDKRPATITITPKQNYCESHKGGAGYISVDFWGHNEGQSGPYDTPEEVETQINYLLQYYKNKYNIQIIDKRIKQEVLF